MATRSTRGEWGPIGILFACNVLFAAGLFAHAFLYNFYLDRLGHGEALMGRAAAALTAGGLAALLPAGILVDRVGPRAAYLVACLAGAAGLLAGAIAESPIAIYAAAFMAGAGTATWRVATGPLLMGMTSPATRERAFSWNVSVLLLSGACWTMISGAAPAWLERSLGLGALGSVRAGLAIGAAGSLAAAAAFLLIRSSPPVLVTEVAGSAAPAQSRPAGRSAATRREHQRQEHAEEEGGRRELPRSLWLLVAVVALWMLAGGMVIPFFNLYFLREHGMEVARIGSLFALAQLITAAFIIGSGDLAARFGAQRLLLVLALPFGPLLWLLTSASSATMAAVLYILQGFVPPATNPLIDQLLLERAPPGRQGTVSTARNAATELAGLIGAALAGSLLESSTFGALFGAAGFVAMIGAIGLMLAFRAFPAPVTQARVTGLSAAAERDAAAHESREPGNIDIGE